MTAIDRPVFIVDGDAVSGALLLDLLDDAGYQAHWFKSGEDALAASRTDPPGLVVLEINLPGVSGYAVCRQLRDEVGPAVGVIFVSGERREPFDRVAGLLIGADDYVVKPFDPDELLARIRAVLRRARPVGTAEDVSSAADLQLTPREQEVLRLLAAGTRQLDIAGELFISPKTVATHIQRILGKLGVHSRAEAVALAHQRNLVDIADAEDVQAHLAGAT